MCHSSIDHCKTLVHSVPARPFPKGVAPCLHLDVPFILLAVPFISARPLAIAWWPIASGVKQLYQIKHFKDFVVGQCQETRHPDAACSIICICICYWQNVLGTHHASAHGGSFGLVVKMLDLIFLK